MFLGDYLIVHKVDYDTDTNEKIHSILAFYVDFTDVGGEVIKFVDEVHGYNYEENNLLINSMDGDVTPDGGVRVIFTDGSYGLRVVDFYNEKETATHNLPITVENFVGLIP